MSWTAISISLSPPTFTSVTWKTGSCPDAPTHAHDEGGLSGGWYIKLPGQSERIAQTPMRGNGASASRIARLRPLLKDAIEDGYGPVSTLAGMDVEGVDVAVVFPTSARGHVTMDDLDPEYATAICRAYNDYLSDFCKKNPGSLKGGSPDLPSQHRAGG